MDETTLTDDDVTTEYGSERAGWISAEAEADADTTDADADTTDADADDTDADGDDADQDADADDPSV